MDDKELLFRVNCINVMVIKAVEDFIINIKFFDDSHFNFHCLDCKKYHFYKFLPKTVQVNI